MVSAQRQILQHDIYSERSTSYACMVPIPQAHAYTHARASTSLHTKWTSKQAKKTRSRARTRKNPVQHAATPSLGCNGGNSSHDAISTLQAATPSFPRFRISISLAIAGGGANAGWNVGNRSLQSLHVKSTSRDKIACMACVARKGASRSRTSYFATRTGTFFKGTRS